MIQSTLPGLPEADWVGGPRIVYYLGSKQRILGSISRAISAVALPGTRVCDLFAGSGTVAVALANRWNVTCVDIQEYSRVLNNALLYPIPELPKWRLVAKEARESSLRAGLRRSLANLIRVERAAVNEAYRGRVAPLADLMDLDPLLTAKRPRDSIPGQLLAAELDAKENLERSGLGTGSDTVITRYYGGVYFTWEQAVDLDSLLSLIHLSEKDLKDFLLAAAFGAATEAVNSVGKHFAQPMRLRDGRGRIKTQVVPQTLRDRTVDIFTAFQNWQQLIRGLKRREGAHRVIRADFRDALADRQLQFDAVYADPPYTRDHYSRFYHILETMAYHDEPEVSVTAIRAVEGRRPSRGLYRLGRHQSPFCIKSRTEGAFDALARGVVSRGVPMVLSYSPYGAENGNRPRLVTVAQVARILERHFSSVIPESIRGFAHNKFNRRDRNVKVDYPAEVLLTCRP